MAGLVTIAEKKGAKGIEELVKVFELITKESEKVAAVTGKDVSKLRTAFEELEKVAGKLEEADRKLITQANYQKILKDLGKAEEAFRKELAETSPILAGAVEAMEKQEKISVHIIQQTQEAAAKKRWPKWVRNLTPLGAIIGTVTAVGYGTATLVGGTELIGLMLYIRKYGPDRVLSNPEIEVTHDGQTKKALMIPLQPDGKGHLVIGAYPENPPEYKTHNGKPDGKVLYYALPTKLSDAMKKKLDNLAEKLENEEKGVSSEELNQLFGDLFIKDDKTGKPKVFAPSVSSYIAMTQDEIKRDTNKRYEWVSEQATVRKDMHWYTDLITPSGLANLAANIPNYLRDQVENSYVIRPQGGGPTSASGFSWDSMWQATKEYLPAIGLAAAGFIVLGPLGLAAGVLGIVFKDKINEIINGTPASTGDADKPKPTPKPKETPAGGTPKDAPSDGKGGKQDTGSQTKLDKPFDEASKEKKVLAAAMGKDVNQIITTDHNHIGSQNPPKIPPTSDGPVV